MDNIEAIFGSETFRGGSVKIGLFYRDTPKGKESHVAAAIKDQKHNLKQVSTRFVDAALAGSRRGRWIQPHYQVNEGAIFKLVIQRKGSKIFYDKQFLFLHCRPKAALRRITIPLTGHQDASLSCGYFEGRFDILDEGGLLSLGVTLTEDDIFGFEDSEDGLSTMEVLEEENTTLRFIEFTEEITAEGKTVRVPKKRGSRRRIKL